MSHNYINQAHMIESYTNYRGWSTSNQKVGQVESNINFKNSHCPYMMSMMDIRLGSVMRHVYKSSSDSQFWHTWYASPGVHSACDQCLQSKYWTHFSPGLLFL